METARTIVDLSTNKTGKYNCKLVDAFEARHGTRDQAVVLEFEEAAE